ncbi:TPA: phosphomannomutase/phosphoglucomutase [Candidatus Magasanikbacteria bacterium]|nr:phosphomannomutase/phosphoglucomutase [Candidatus Magasanikbacteria bacterium]
MSIAENIFKSYDIRGLIKGELSEDLAYKIGRSFAVFLKKNNLLTKGQKVVSGRDMRLTSLGFQNEVIRGLNDEGLDVVNIGLCSTPFFNFACAYYSNYAGGVMVTASHNPAEYNGFKFTLGSGLAVGKENGLMDLKNFVLANDFEEVIDKGNVEDIEIFADYRDKVFSLIKKENIKPLKIVVDAGNGMAKVTLPKILSELPVEVEYLYLEPDGNFPNHEANPLKLETLQDLQKKVLETQADFGFALDGDADRIGLVDEKGDIVEASFVGALLGLAVLKNHPGAKMLYDLRSSKSVAEIWQQAGASVEMCKVGHSNIKKQMRDVDAVFASELSLHIYFGDVYKLEITDLSLLYVLQILSEDNRSLSEIWHSMQKYYHSGEINFEIEDKEKVLKKLKEKYSDAKILELDGFSFYFDNFWFNVRLSNTEPVLRLNLEADSEELMKKKVKEVSEIIKS